MDDQRVARDKAIERVEFNSIVWRSFARRALRDAAVSSDELTSDDVWWILRYHDIPDPTEPRAMGPVMLRGVRDGWIVSTNRTKISDDPASPNHNRPQRVYLSRITGREPSVWDNRAPWDRPERDWRRDDARMVGPYGIPGEYLSSSQKAEIDRSFEPREFPLQRDEDGRVSVNWATCSDCGGQYGVLTDHLRTYQHRQWLAKSQTIEAAIPEQPQKETFAFTQPPMEVAFGSAVICPRCKGLRRKIKGQRTELCMDPSNPKVPCIRCNGFGIVPNVGPVVSAADTE